MIQIKKISILIAIFFIIGCSLTDISATDVNDTIAINEENNYNNLEKVSTATNFTTLQQEINENDEIILNNNITMSKEEQGNFSNGIVINKTIAIDGKGYTIDANSLGRIFQITNNESVLTLKNITLMNGNSTGEGGAIYGTGDINLNCDNVSFVNNTATYKPDEFIITSIYSDGGSIYSGGLVCINGGIVNFVNNTANAGGAIYASSVVINATNVSFVDNKARTDNAGGAIYASSIVINATIVSFVNNTAQYINDYIKFTGYNISHGGAIYSDGVVSINSNSVSFVNNTADTYGAAIYASNIIVNATNVSFVNNIAHVHGGAIYSSNSLVINATNVSFVNNNVYAPSRGTGHISQGGAIYAPNVIINATNVTFDNNYANGDGGAIYASSVLINAINVSFVKNKAGNMVHGYGGAIYSNIVNINSGSLSFVNNSGNCAFWCYGYTGGAIYSNGDVVINTSSLSIINNTNHYAYGGAIYSDGEVKLYVDDLTGINNMCSDVNGSSFYSSFYTNSSTIMINNKSFENSLFGQSYRYLGNVLLTVNDLTKYYGDNEQLTAILIKDAKRIANETITFTINGREYNRTTDENGTARMNINLNPGIYTVTASYNNSNVSISNDAITILTTINANDLVKIYHNNSQFYANFLNTNGSALANTNVTFNINGVFYNRYTDENGTAKLNINLDSGKYVLTAINPLTKENKGFNITVLSTVKSSDIIKFYRNGTQYLANFTAINGSALANISVKFNINGVFYTKTTDNNGTAILNINLQPGKYVLTTINPITNESIGNNVTVQSVLVGEDLNKTYSEEKSYELKVIDGQGKILPNQTVQMNIHGVVYNKTTDSNGIARLAIHLEVGDYIITTTWNGTFTSNKISVSSSKDVFEIHPAGIAVEAIYCKDCGGYLSDVILIPDLGLNIVITTSINSTCSHYNSSNEFDIYKIPILDFYSGWFVSDDAYNSFIYKATHSLKDNSTSLENKTLNDIDWDKWVNLTYDSSNSTDNNTIEQNISNETYIIQDKEIVGPLNWHTIFCKDCGEDVYKTNTMFSLQINNNTDINILEDLGFNHGSFNSSSMSGRGACSHYNGSLNIELFDIPILDFYSGWFVSDDAYNSFIYKATHSLKDNSTSLENKTLNDIDWDKWVKINIGYENVTLPIDTPGEVNCTVVEVPNELNNTEEPIINSNTSNMMD